MHITSDLGHKLPIWNIILLFVNVYFPCGPIIFQIPDEGEVVEVDFL